MTCSLALCLAGCAVGPRALQQSSTDYNHALQRATDEQLLINIVRLRYRDSPLFLEVGSISAQFRMNKSAAVSLTIPENVAGNPPNVFDADGQVGYEERPTITFTPLRGEAFVQRLMAPLEIDTIMLLYYSGWSVDRILRLTAQNLNRVENARTASGPTPDVAPAYEDFARVSTALRLLQQRGHLSLGYETEEVAVSDPIPAERVTGQDAIRAAEQGFRFRPTEAKTGVVLTGPTRQAVLHIAAPARARAEGTAVVTLLGLAADRSQYAIRTGLAAPPAVETGGLKSIAVGTRSLAGVLFYLSQAVEVPPAHEAAGLVTVTRGADGAPFDWRRVTGDLFRVHASADRPARAAVAVPYRGHWFYIAEEDLTSKSTFALLGQLFSLQAGRTESAGPVLTLPIGG